MSSVSVLIDLQVPGYVIGDLTVTTQKWQDRTVVSSAGCTLTALGTRGRYWLTHPTVTELLGFEAYVTAWPENYELGSFDPFVRPTAAAPSAGTASVIDLHAPGYTIADLTITLQRRSDKAVVSTAGMSLAAIGSTGRYWLIHPNITEVTGFEVYVTDWPENYAFGLLDPSAWPFRWTTDTNRQSIMAALAERMATITVANGFRTNAGQHVFSWKEAPFLSTEIPGIEIRDIAEDTGYIAVGEHLHRLAVDVRVISTTGTAVRSAIADVVTAVGQDVTFTGLAEDTSIQADGTIDNDASGESPRYGSVVKLTIEYVTVPFTP